MNERSQTSGRYVSIAERRNQKREARRDLLQSLDPLVRKQFIELAVQARIGTNAERRDFTPLQTGYGIKHADARNVDFSEHGFCELDKDE